MRKIKLIVTVGVDGGYWGSIGKSDTAFAFGQTIEELVANTKEGIESYAKDCGQEVPEYELELVAGE